ncbi:MAG: stage 0 sporulation family protein [Desulfobacterium sp.]|nr:stage 0 sporulation family protein [Desulfobacterium sp.]
MTKIAGIRFKPAGKIYDFDCGAFVLNIGDKVIVETEQGLGFGVVTVPPAPLESEKKKKQLKKVFRIATEADFKKREQNKALEQQAFDFCQGCISKLGLKMNLFSVESTFDAAKLTFFYTADGRVDFRELVKILVKEYRIRIEMRQVGIRNQSKQCGGLGRCGREICCSLFMKNFDPVSIKMAKEQGLSLNPTKISGLCGRLMCCLTFENKTYKLLKKELPKPGKVLDTAKGRGKVIRQNVLKGTVTLRLEDGSEIEADLKDLSKG